MNKQSPILLIVEDEIELNEIFKEYALDTGCQVLTASSGHEAFNLIVTEKPDILMTDIKMPEMSGIILLQKLQIHSIRIPTIICSASLLDSEAAALEELKDYFPIVAMLEKPLQSNLFEKAISAAVAQK